MSMELYALSERRLNSIAEWQAEIDRLGWPLKIDDNADFSKIGGFLPATWEGQRTGFECDHWPIDDVAEGYPGVVINPMFRHVLAFRWGNLDECVAAVHACAAYASGAIGQIRDCEQGKVISSQEAADQARQAARFLPQAKRLMQEQLERLKSQK